MDPAKTDTRPAVETAPSSGTHIRDDRAGDTQRTPVTAGKIIVDVEGVDFHYGQTKALHGINLKVPERQVTAFIGPSGCGKSTLLRCFNRMNHLIDDVHIGGRIPVQGPALYA